MRLNIFFCISYVFIQLGSAYAMEPLVLCPLCEKSHSFEIIIKENSDQVIIPIEKIPEIAARYFPCLATELNNIQTWEFLPQNIGDEASASRTANKYAISKKDLLNLCFLSLISPDGSKHPFTREQGDFIRENNEWEAHTTKWLGWRAVLVFTVFSFLGGASNFFTFITIYNTNSSNTSVENTNASLGVQNLLICIGSASFNLIMSYLGLVLDRIKSKYASRDGR